MNIQAFIDEYNQFNSDNIAQLTIAKREAELVILSRQIDVMKALLAQEIMDEASRLTKDSKPC